MNSEQLPENDPNAYNPNFEAQDEELESTKGNRLMYILVGVIVLLVVTYIMLPKGSGSGMASITPTFVLDDAAVTATAPTAADSIAAGLKAAPADATETAETKPVARVVAAAGTNAVAAAPAAATATEAAPAEAAPAPAAAPATVAAAPEPAAPATVTITGKIDDENGRPLAGATVMLKGSTKVASTDANGNYSIEAPAGADNTLIYGYGGYDDEEQRATAGKPLNVTLTPRAKAGRKRR